jgi:hypothetical protein
MCLDIEMRSPLVVQSFLLKCETIFDVLIESMLVFLVLFSTGPLVSYDPESKMDIVSLISQ